MTPSSGRRRQAAAPSTSAGDLHGSAPDTCPVALLIIDAINDFAFDGAGDVLAEARPMAVHISRLKQRVRRAGIPTIYVNDNFGRWRSDFRSLVAHCTAERAPGRAISRRLRPDADDYFVLKPKHSGFFSTTLDLLLQHLGTQVLILTGLLAEICILFTAQDAYMRGYQVVVPADCVASRSRRDRERALAHLRRAVGATTPPSARLDLDALLRSARAPAAR